MEVFLFRQRTFPPDGTYSHKRRLDETHVISAIRAITMGARCPDLTPLLVLFVAITKKVCHNTCMPPDREDLTHGVSIRKLQTSEEPIEVSART